MRRAYGLLVGAFAVIVAAGVTATLVTRSAQPSQYRISAGLSDCGDGWSHPQAGRQSFDVTNNTIAGMEVYLQAAGAGGGIYLDLESIGAGVTVHGTATIGAGSYRFVCLPADENPVHGATVTVTGARHVAGETPGIPPVTENDLIPASKTYGDWIQGRLPTLAAEVAALNADVASGNLAAARTDWLAGHLEYETLGAAYGAFGDADTAINGMPASGRTALDDPDLFGFHKIEGLLYAGAPASEIAPFTNKLVEDVGAMQRDFPKARIDPLDIGLRAHEILENALQFELTTKADAGSHTDLATLDANLTGTSHALQPLEGILKVRYPKLAETTTAIAATQTLVERYRQPDGSWTPVQALTNPERQQLDARVDATLALLAPVAAICDVRRAP